MLLAIDIGNSNVVIGLVRGTEIYRKARVATDTTKTSDQYWVELKNVLSLLEVQAAEIEGVIISSVVPQVLQSCRSAVKKLTGLEPMVVGPGMKTGINILLDNPAQAGSDLIVSAVAALATYPKPLLVVDMGTATTIVAVDHNGSFLGGCIAPGVKLSARALTEKTAQLPAISLEAPRRAIGRNTVESMQSGIMMGAAAMVDGMVERMEAELGEPATVVATGGIARFVLPLCKRKILYDGDLILKGLVILYGTNRKQPK